MVEEGGLQPIVTLAYSPDPDVHQQAAAALRGLSVTTDIKMKIVQEGALEPLTRLLTSEDIEILREVCAALNNLSLGDENKFEIAKSSATDALISHMQSEDMQIASQAGGCLANLCEMDDNQRILTEEGGIRPTIAVMRSRFVEVQREAGRLLANLCADSGETSDKIMEGGGHQLLISYLLSQDAACQRVGALGIGNLCTQERHRKTLMQVGVLEPLCTLARSEDIELEIQRYAVLAIANLASEKANHPGFVEEGMLPLLISLSNVPDAEVPIPALTDKDRKDLAFACEQGADWIALSFVQRPEDVAEARKLMTATDGMMPALCAKIEKPSAVRRLAEIVDLSDGIMVARGDLGVEMPPEDVPIVQKEIIEECRRQGKPVIVATQMLESMIDSPAPTRAECSDVATAIFDGCDAIMLSGESAAGKYPEESVRMQQRLVRRVEASTRHQELVRMGNIGGYEPPHGETEAQSFWKLDKWENAQRQRWSRQSHQLPLARLMEEGN